MNRKKRAQIAQETLAILEKGFYQSPDKKKVSLQKSLQRCIDGTVWYQPDNLDSVVAQSTKTLRDFPTTKASISVCGKTTLKAAADLLETNEEKVVCLNFASAKNPGGGFLGGSQAQEESLARATGMYPCLISKQGMYDTNRQHRSCLYTDHMIFSPQVPVFRDDNDSLLDDYYEIGIITSPAVNRGAVEKNEKKNLAKIKTTMLSRIEKVLAVAVVHGYRRIVLGAWGCGVFRNNPQEIASYFAHFLHGSYQNAFSEVVFAVVSDSDRKWDAFAKTFSH